MSTAFQPDAFQSDAFQELGGLTTADVNISVAYTNRPDVASIQITVAGTDVTGGWWVPRLKKKKRIEEPEVIPNEVIPEEEPQTAMAEALRRASIKVRKAEDRAVEQAAKEYAAEVVARAAAQQRSVELQQAIAAERRRRDEEELVLMLLTSTRKRKTRQPA